MCADESSLTVDLETIGPRTSSPTDMMSKLPATGCRYAIYDHDYTRPDGRPASKLYLVCWVPSMGKPSSRMFYTSQKSKVAPFFDGVETLAAHGAADIEAVIGGRATGTRDAVKPSGKPAAEATAGGGGEDDEDDPFADDEDFE